MIPQKIFVTGAGGYIGRRLTNMFSDYGHSVISCVRKLQKPIPQHSKTVEVKDIASFNKWNVLLQGCDSIIHL